MMKDYTAEINETSNQVLDHSLVLAQQLVSLFASKKYMEWQTPSSRGS